MLGLKETLEYAKNNFSKAIDIENNSLKKPSNVYLFDHAIPGSTSSSFMIDNNIIWFPNIKSRYGTIITNPNNQYILCNELFDCVGIGGTLEGKTGETHIFGAHVYESILKYQMEYIIEEIQKKELIPKTVIYSPGEDTGSWDKGLKVLQKNFPKTINILRPKENEASLILNQEGFILNGKFHNF